MNGSLSSAAPAPYICPPADPTGQFWEMVNATRLIFLAFFSLVASPKCQAGVYFAGPQSPNTMAPPSLLWKKQKTKIKTKKTFPSRCTCSLVLSSKFLIAVVLSMKRHWIRAKSPFKFPEQFAMNCKKNLRMDTVYLNHAIFLFTGGDIRNTLSCGQTKRKNSFYIIFCRWLRSTSFVLRTDSKTRVGIYCRF